MFTFIKDVSDTVFDMINAVYRDKPLIFIGAIHLSLSRAVSGTVLDLLVCTCISSPIIV